MDTNNHISEKGQAIVYLVIGLVVFLGFVAMAIDGGMALADRRHVQNAADAGSLAGGGMAARALEISDVTNDNWNCSDSYMATALTIAETTAESRTVENITLDPTLGDELLIDAHCNSNPQYLELTVDVIATTPSNFLQLIFPDALQNNVNAVSRVYPRQPLAYGNAIVALNPATECIGMGKTGAGFTGDSSVNVNGGGIFSNGCLQGAGSAGNVTVNDAGISWVSEYDPGNKNFIPTPVGPVNPIPTTAYNVQSPDCTGRWFTDFPVHANITPGLYCFHGGLDFKNGPYNGTGITIYTEGGVTINGNQVVNLSAENAPSPAIPGVLFYLPPTNHNVVKLNGTSNVTLTGTILAPGADIDISGTTDIHSFYSQIIGWNVKVSGTALLIVDYEAGKNGNLPTFMELYK